MDDDTAKVRQPWAAARALGQAALAFAAAARTTAEAVKAQQNKVEMQMDTDLNHDTAQQQPMELDGGKDKSEPGSPERSELTKTVADIDALITKPQPMEADESVKLLIKSKREEKEAALASLRAKRPTRTQLKVAAEMLDKARSRHAKIKEEEQSLKILLEDKQRQMREVAQEITGHMAEVSTLEFRLREEGLAEFPQPTGAAESRVLLTAIEAGVPCAQAVLMQQWHAFQQLCQAQAAAQQGAAAHHAAPQTPVRQPVPISIATPRAAPQEVDNEGDPDYGPALAPFKRRTDPYASPPVENNTKAAKALAAKAAAAATQASAVPTPQAPEDLSDL